MNAYDRHAEDITPRVAFVGDGDRWALAVQRATGRPPEAALSEGASAAVIGAGVKDPFACAKQALLLDVPVLYAAPSVLSPWQAGVLSELSRRRGVLLRHAEPFRYQAGFSFLRRLLQGDEPFWQPLYLRSIRAAEPRAQARLDELATAELAVFQTLLQAPPRRVTAHAARTDASGAVTALFMTIEYADGVNAHATVTAAEAAPQHELVAVTPDRTVVLDELDRRSPLKVLGGAEMNDLMLPAWHAGSHSGEHDPAYEEVRRFLDAVLLDDRSFSNGERWATVAALWWAARQSMSFGGPVDVPAASPLTETEPPPLRVIEGGGRSRSRSRRPVLSLVGN